MNNNQTVFITGSSRGIGKAIGFLFAKQNYNVVLNCINNIDLLNETVKEFHKFNKNVIGVQGDVGNFNHVLKIQQEIKNHFGNVDVLINNAGISQVCLFGDSNNDDWNKIIQTNLMSVIYCSNIFLKPMVKKKSGTIINISSIWGNCGASCEVLYSTTKGGVNSFTKSLAKELGTSKININAIACGVIDTDMNSWLTKDEVDFLINEIPMSRFGTPEEVAELCLFLSSEKAKYITGQVINIDGGMI